MIRSRLKNRFNKTGSGEDCLLYKTESHFWKKLLRKTKKHYFAKRKPNFFRTIKTFDELLNPISKTKETFLTK